jgi:hypothetical protein
LESVAGGAGEAESALGNKASRLDWIEVSRLFVTSAGLFLSFFLCHRADFVDSPSRTFLISFVRLTASCQWGEVNAKVGCPLIATPSHPRLS